MSKFDKNPWKGLWIKDSAWLHVVTALVLWNIRYLFILKLQESHNETKRESYGVGKDMWISLKVLLRRKFFFLFPSFFNINLLYMFKIIQIAKNWNDTCVRGLEISHWKVRKYRPPLQSSQSNSPRGLRKAVVRLTTWFMHCDVVIKRKSYSWDVCICYLIIWNVFKSTWTASKVSKGNDTEYCNGIYWIFNPIKWDFTQASRFRHPQYFRWAWWADFSSGNWS